MTRSMAQTPQVVRVPVIHGADVEASVIGWVELACDQLPSGMAWHLELRPTFKLRMSEGSYETLAFHLVVRQVKPSMGQGVPPKAITLSPRSLPQDIRCRTCGLGMPACVCS